MLSGRASKRPNYFVYYKSNGNENGYKNNNSVNSMMVWPSQ